MVTVEQDDENKTYLVLLVLASLEKTCNLPLKFVAENAFAVDLHFAIMEKVDFACHGLLDEFIYCMYVHFDLLAPFSEVVDLIEALLLASHAHLHTVELLLELHLTGGQVATLYPHLVPEVHLHHSLSLDDAVAVGRHAVDAFEQSCVGDAVVEDREEVEVTVEKKNQVVRLPQGCKIFLRKDSTLRKPVTKKSSLLLLTRSKHKNRSMFQH